MWYVFHHWGLPLFGAVCWWGMLIALIVAWSIQGKPIYKVQYQSTNWFVYISDVGATNLQPIFISCAGAQGLCYVLATVSERYLRHAGRLVPNRRRLEKVLAGFSIGLGIIGQLGILFVSIFNTNAFPHVHVAMLCVFIVFTGLSILCVIGEFFLLDRAYSGIRRLKISYAFKTLFFICALALAVSFAALHHKRNAAAVCEWTLSFLYGFYLLSLVYDLWPAHNKDKGHHTHKKDSERTWSPQEPEMAQMEQMDQMHQMDSMEPIDRRGQAEVTAPQYTNF